MTPGEQGFLLLTQQLGDPNRKPLTLAQFRELTLRARKMEQPSDEDRALELRDLVGLGCDFLTGEHILSLLSQESLLQSYLDRGRNASCIPISRISPSYPEPLRKKLDTDAPGCLWAKGDLSLLSTPMLGLVGSRDLYPENFRFAQEAGRQAALQGYTLVSGNARGADTEAQKSCLAQGGKVISVVADRLDAHPLEKNILYLSENGFDLPFSAARALSRNRIIHCLPQAVLVAQVTHGKGGTWGGALRNLKQHWTPLFCFPDGRQGTKALLEFGAGSVTLPDLKALDFLR